MKATRLLPFVLAFLLAACGTSTPPTTDPGPPLGPPTTPVGPLPPVTPPTTPTPPTNGAVPYYGEWIITYTSDYGVSFVHALEITEDVSDEGLQNAGGGLQEFCIGGGGDVCEGTYGSGVGFIGNLVLDDGTAPLTLAIVTAYSGETPETKFFSVDDIQMETDSQGRQTFTVDGVWNLSGGDFDVGTINATNVGAPKTLQPLATKDLRGRVTKLAKLVRSFR